MDLSAFSNHITLHNPSISVSMSLSFLVSLPSSPPPSVSSFHLYLGLRYNAGVGMRGRRRSMAKAVYFSEGENIRDRHGGVEARTL